MMGDEGGSEVCTKAPPRLLARLLWDVFVFFEEPLISSHRGGTERDGEELAIPLCVFAPMRTLRSLASFLYFHFFPFLQDLCLGF
jgi:hypothetical protein